MSDIKTILDVADKRGYLTDADLTEILDSSTTHGGTVDVVEQLFAPSTYQTINEYTPITFDGTLDDNPIYLNNPNYTYTFVSDFAPTKEQLIGSTIHYSDDCSFDDVVLTEATITNYNDNDGILLDTNNHIYVVYDTSVDNTFSKVGTYFVKINDDGYVKSLSKTETKEIPNQYSVVDKVLEKLFPPKQTLIDFTWNGTFDGTEITSTVDSVTHSIMKISDNYFTLEDVNAGNVTIDTGVRGVTTAFSDMFIEDVGYIFTPMDDAGAYPMLYSIATPGSVTFTEGTGTYVERNNSSSYGDKYLKYIKFEKSTSPETDVIQKVFTKMGQG